MIFAAANSDYEDLNESGKSTDVKNLK